jgi:hypothetical protein
MMGRRYCRPILFRARGHGLSFRHFRGIQLTSALLPMAN